jgi:SAM-dependent methyltransferase
VTLGRVLREARRVLRPGGALVLYTPDRQHVFERLRERGVMKQDPSHIGVRSRGGAARRRGTVGLPWSGWIWLPSHLPVLGLTERALARWVPLLRRRIGLVAEPGDALNVSWRRQTFLRLGQAVLLAAIAWGIYRVLAPELAR